MVYWALWCGQHAPCRSTGSLHALFPAIWLPTLICVHTRTHMLTSICPLPHCFTSSASWEQLQRGAFAAHSCTIFNTCVSLSVFLAHEGKRCRFRAFGLLKIQHRWAVINSNVWHWLKGELTSPPLYRYLSISKTLQINVLPFCLKL